MLREEKSDTSGKDLLTLLVHAKLQVSDGMSDSDVRARECFFALLSSVPQEDQRVL